MSVSFVYFYLKGNSVSDMAGTSSSVCSFCYHNNGNCYYNMGDTVLCPRSLCPGNCQFHYRCVSYVCNGFYELPLVEFPTQFTKRLHCLNKEGVVNQMGVVN